MQKHSQHDAIHPYRPMHVHAPTPAAAPVAAAAGFLTGSTMSAAQAWKDAIQQLKELHKLIAKYQQHLTNNRCSALQTMASIEALAIHLRTKERELTSVRCPSDAEWQQIVLKLKVCQPVLSGARFFWGEAGGGGGTCLNCGRESLLRQLQQGPAPVYLNLLSL